MRTAHLALALAVCTVLLACDGEEPDAAPDAAPDDAAVTFTAVGVAPFEGPDSVPAGQVTLTFVNDDGVGHNLTIEELSEATSTIGGGEEEQLVVELEPGETYTLFCSVPGHRDAGMELEVTTS